MVLNEFPSIFQKVQHSYSRHQKTTSNLLRINLKGILKFNEIWPLEGAIHTELYGRIFRGHPQFFFFLCNFLRKLMVSDNNIHRAFRTHEYNSIKQKRLEKFFIFTIYQNYTLALISCILSLKKWGYKPANLPTSHSRNLIKTFPEICLRGKYPALGLVIGHKKMSQCLQRVLNGLTYLNRDKSL